MAAIRNVRVTRPAASPAWLRALVCVGVLSLVAVAQAPAGTRPAPPKPAAPAKVPAAANVPTSTRPAPTDAAVVLAGARETLLGAPVWSYHCKAAVMAAGAMMFGSDTQQILRHNARGAMTGLRITGTLLPSGLAFDAGCDGARMTAVDLRAKTWETTPWSASTADAPPPEPGAGTGSMLLHFVVPSAVEHVELLAPGADTVVRLGGTLALDGVLCDVVAVEYDAAARPPGGGPGKATVQYAVGRDDQLVRRITTGASTPDDHSASAVGTHDLTDWVRNPSVTDASFAVVTSGCKPGPLMLPSGGPPDGDLPGVNDGPDAGPSIGLKVGDTPPAFALKDVNGKDVKSVIYKGRAALVHFSTLDGDLGEALLTRMKAKHGDNLVVVDLVVDHARGGPDAVKRAKKPVSFTRLVGGETVAAAWHVNQFPSAIIIGADGRVAGIMQTGARLAAAGKSDPLIDAIVKKMGDYLKDPSKGW